MMKDKIVQLPPRLCPFGVVICTLMAKAGDDVSSARSIARAWEQRGFDVRDEKGKRIQLSRQLVEGYIYKGHSVRTDFGRWFSEAYGYEMDDPEMYHLGYANSYQTLPDGYSYEEEPLA